MHESWDENEEKGMPILIHKDQTKEGCSTGMIFAHIVPKDSPPYAVMTLAGAIGQLGHREVIPFWQEAPDVFEKYPGSPFPAFGRTFSSPGRGVAPK